MYDGDKKQKPRKIRIGFWRDDKRIIEIVDLQTIN